MSIIRQLDTNDPYPTRTDTNIHWFTIRIQGLLNGLIVVSIYLHPTTNQQTFSWLEYEINNKYEHTEFNGDTINNTTGTHLQQLINELHLTCINTIYANQQPTHNRIAILDLVYTNVPHISSNMTIDNMNPDLQSDRYPITSTFHHNIPIIENTAHNINYNYKQATNAQYQNAMNALGSLYRSHIYCIGQIRSLGYSNGFDKRIREVQTTITN